MLSITIIGNQLYNNEKDVVTVILFEYEFHWVIDGVTTVNGEIHRNSSDSFLKSEINEEEATSIALEALKAEKYFYNLEFPQ